MQTVTLEQARQLVDQLSLSDQARLLEYLAPRLVHTVIATQQVKAIEKGLLPKEWQEFFRIGDTIAALEMPQAETLTSAVTSSRR